MKYTRTQLFDIQKAMQVYGGSFVRKLSELLPLADDDNLERIVNAFPEYFAEYLEKTQWLK